jgi:hypothetical protein
VGFGSRLAWGQLELAESLHLSLLPTYVVPLIILAHILLLRRRSIIPRSA